jgi:hypothetical protein
MHGKMLLVIGLLVLGSGCGVGAGGTTPNLKRMIDRTKVANQFSQIGLAYMNCATTGAPPQNVEDLMQYLENDAAIGKLLRDGTVVVIWGIRPGQVQNASDKILAYEKDADDQGLRYVLMADMKAVRPMSNADFAKAPKADGK